MLYLLDPAHLGQLAANDVQVVQKLPVNGGHVMGGPVFWDSSAAGPLVYNWAEDDVLRSSQVSNGRLVTPSYAQGGVVSPGHPGGSLDRDGERWGPGNGDRVGVHADVAGRRPWARGRNSARLRRRDAAGDLDQRTERRPRSHRHADEVRASGRGQRQGLHAQSGWGRGGVRAPACAGRRLQSRGQSIRTGDRRRAVRHVRSSGHRVGGFGDSVALSAAGQPTGTTISFAPASINGAGTSTMVVSLPPDVADGTYPITIKGTSGSSVRSATLRITTGPVRAIGVSFVGSSTVPMGAAESAGVVPQTNWNNAVGASRTSDLALVDASGNPTTATVTWSSAGTWLTPITDQPGNRRLMKGYLDTTSASSTTVNVAGLRNKPTTSTSTSTAITRPTIGRRRTRSAARASRGNRQRDRCGERQLRDHVHAREQLQRQLRQVHCGRIGIQADRHADFAGERHTRAPVNGIQVVPAAPPVPDFTLPPHLPLEPLLQEGRRHTARHRSREWIHRAGRTDPGRCSCGTGRDAQFLDRHRSRHGDLKIDSTSATPIGMSSLTITGTSGDLIHQATVTLSVAPPPPVGKRNRDPVRRQQHRLHGCQ